MKPSLHPVSGVNLDDKPPTAQAFTDCTGAVIVIRRARPADAEALVAYVNQIDTESGYLSREPGEFGMTVEQERQFIAHLDGVPNAVYLTAWDGDLLIGTIDYHGGNWRRNHLTGEFGLSVRQSHWRRGIGHALLGTLLAWAKANPLVHKVKLRVRADHAVAIKLYRSLGFVDEGVFRREIVVDGVWHDLLLMAWFKDESSAASAGSIE